MKIAGMALFLLLPFLCAAQLIKKKLAVTPSRLNNIYVANVHFEMETLDSVYKYFQNQYGVKIDYDVNYCKKRTINYWFTQTALPLAIEITTRGNRLSYSIDSLDVIHVKRSGLTEQNLAPDEDNNEITEIRMITPQIRREGPPKRLNFTLSGRVLDFNTGEPLPFALLKINGSTNVTSANGDGYFSLLNVPSDTASIVINYIGYTGRTVFINPGDPTDNFEIELIPAEHSLSEVVVTGNKEDLIEVSSDNLSVIKMSPKKLAELPNLGEKDIMRSFQLMPGISAANESSSGMYVRGGTPDQNLVVYDGFTIYHVDHLYGFFSAFNANAIKDVQLYKGGFDSKFGGRLSSVMEVTGKEGNQKKFNLGGDLSLLSGNIYTEIPLTEKITILGAWRRSWKGPIYNWIFKSFNKDDESQSVQPGGPGGIGGADSKTTSYFSDINTKVTFRPTKNDNISYSFFYSIDKLDNSFNFSAPSGFGGNTNSGGFSNGTTDLTKYGNVGMSIKWGRKWSDKLYGNTTFGYSDYYSKRDRSNDRTTTDADGNESTVKTGILENNTLKDLSGKSEYEWNMSKHNQIGFGAFGTLYDINYSYSQNDTSDVLSRADHGYVAGGYLQDKFSFWHNKIELKAGLRLSYFDITSKLYKEPRLSFAYKMTKNLSLRGSWGQYYQFANRITREDILSGSKDFWILSDDKKVPVSSATHYIVGLSYETGDYLFSAETYYKRLFNLTEYSLRFTSTFRTTTYDENFYSGYGYSKGLELLAQKKFGKFTGWVSYTLAQAQNHFDVYSADYYPANQDVTHEFKIVGIYKYKRWDFSATWIYATGRPYTAPGGAYTITLLDGTTQDYFTVTSKNSLRLPDYHRADIAVNYHIFNQSKKDIGFIGVSIFNVYNRTNVWYKQYYVSGNEIVETNVNYLGITPNLTLSLKIR